MMSLWDTEAFLKKHRDMCDTALRMIEHLKEISKMPNCNDCKERKCKHRPKLGDPVRYNCPLWKGDEDE